MTKFAIVAFTLVSAQFAWATDQARYPSTSMKALEAQIEKELPTPRQKNTADFIATMSGYSVLVEYTGESRKLSGSRRDFVDAYAKMKRQPKLGADYQREIKVIESGHFYWLPVQEAFFGDLAKELKKGQKFIIYVGFAGKTTGHENVLLMMDFNADKAAVAAALRSAGNEADGIRAGR